MFNIKFSYFQLNFHIFIAPTALPLFLPLVPQALWAGCRWHGGHIQVLRFACLCCSCTCCRGDLHIWRISYIMLVVGAMGVIFRWSRLWRLIFFMLFVLFMVIFWRDLYLGRLQLIIPRCSASSGSSSTSTCSLRSRMMAIWGCKGLLWFFNSGPDSTPDFLSIHLDLLTFLFKISGHPDGLVNAGLLGLPRVRVNVRGESPTRPFLNPQVHTLLTTSPHTITWTCTLLTTANIK